MQGQMQYDLVLSRKCGPRTFTLCSWMGSESWGAGENPLWLRDRKGQPDWGAKSQKLLGETAEGKVPSVDKEKGGKDIGVASWRKGEVILENSKREGKSQNWEIRAGDGGRSWTTVECGESHSRSKYSIKDGTHHWEKLMKTHLNCGSYPPCISLSAQVTSPRRVHICSWALHPGTCYPALIFLFSCPQDISDSYIFGYFVHR